MSARMALPPFDPFAPEFREDPYPRYHAYRAREPVHWGRAPDGVSPGCWYVTGYAEAVTVLKDPQFGVEAARALPPEAFPPMPAEYEPFFRMGGQSMIFRDPPDHARLRRLVTNAFSRRAVETWRPEVETITAAPLEAVAPAGELDLIADLAFPLPVLVIGELLGVPPTRRADLRDWSESWDQSTYEPRRRKRPSVSGRAPRPPGSFAPISLRSSRRGAGAPLRTC